MTGFAQIVLGALALICALDAAFVAVLAPRTAGDPFASRATAALSLVILACGALCLAASQIAGGR